MAKVIYKYPVNRILSTIELPVDAKVLSCQIDMATDEPAIWVELDPNAVKVKRTFKFFPTGENISDTVGELKFIATVQFQKLGLIFHLFEVN